MRLLKVIFLLVLASTLVFAKHTRIARDLDNADPSAGHCDIFMAGTGYLDVWAPLSSSDTAPAGKPALSPTVQSDPRTHKVMLVLGATLVWGDSWVWVSRALHGFSIVWGS
jgi:hypothetical protein